ncbi:MAG: glycine C-acetyltransferase [Patescibacteria group bacterium]
MFSSLQPIITKVLEEIRSSGLYKSQRVLESRQGAVVRTQGKEVINFCANNYLGLAGSDILVDEAKKALDRYGYGLSSVRFICGTQTVHKDLERETAAFLKKESALAFGSCWDANEGLFAAMLNEEDAVISDALNHASIIDGLRLCKAERHVYAHLDLHGLEEKLKATQGKRVRCIVTDGVFSMEGEIAPLPQICDLAEKYNAVVVVDDSHATGFMGDTGRGTHEYHRVEDRVDVITTTFGKALGGATGGCIAGPSALIELLEQRVRTSLFTNALPPVVAGTTIAVLQHLKGHPELRERLWDNTKHFRAKMAEAGFTLPASVHPIVPVIVGEGKVALGVAEDMLSEGIYVIGFSYPVVPMGRARIRVQISAAHTTTQIDTLVSAFVKLGKKYGIVK